jgi:hypothetical protein
MEGGFIELIKPDWSFNPTDAEKAWLACAIDSEGSIINSRKKLYYKLKDGSKRIYFRDYLVLIISNSDRGFVEKAYDIIKYGRVSSYKTLKPRIISNINGKIYNCKKTVWRYDLDGLQKVVDVLKAISPYLVTEDKQRKARQAIKQFDGRGYHRDWYWSDEDKKKLAYLKEHEKLDWKTIGHIFNKKPKTVQVYYSHRIKGCK